MVTPQMSNSRDKLKAVAVEKERASLSRNTNGRGPEALIMYNRWSVCEIRCFSTELGEIWTSLSVRRTTRWQRLGPLSSPDREVDVQH